MRRPIEKLLVLFCLVAAPLAAFAAQIPFGPQRVISTSEGYGIDVISGDLDGDGDLDLVGIGGTNAPSGVYWYENLDGKGTMSSAHLIDGSSGQLGTPASIQLVDMDGDGDLDLLTGTFSDCVWYANDGHGHFGARTVVRSDWGFVAFKAADIDGDGDLDVVGVVGYGADKIAWFRNNGGGSFNPASENFIDALPNGSGEGDVIPADIDGDGKIDLVVLQSTSGDQVAWYRSLGAGSFSAKQTIATMQGDAGGVAVADIDGDGDLDVVSADYSFNNVRWHENLGGNGSAWTNHTIATSDCVSFFVKIADMDGDGDPDVLVATRVTNEARWIENTGHGTSWSNHLITGNVAWPLATIAADLDGDGDPDVVTASLNDTKFAWNENRTIHRNAVFSTPSQINFANPYSVVAVDVDGDGDMDALSASTNKFVWYENNGGSPPVFTERVISSTVFAPNSAFAADLDGDGDMDALLTGAGDDNVTWYENNGARPPVWTARTIGALVDPLSVVAADVDHDGDIDVVSASTNGHKIVWYENNGAHPPAWTERTIASGLNGGPNALVASDLDGDGDVDVFSSVIGEKIAWYENNGARPPVWTAHTIIADVNIEAVYAADVDGDGDVDLLTASAADEIAWYENNGGSPPVFTPHTITTAVSFASSVFAADMDGDGDMDVLSASRDDRKIAWYENNGGSPPVFTPHTIGIAASIARTVFAADMDGDGDPDVLACFDGTSWFENRGGQYAFTGADLSTGSAYDGELAPVLAVGVQVFGRPGDSVGALATLAIRFESGSHVALSSAQANALFDELRIYRDDGSGAFESSRDILVTTVSTLSLSGGVQTVTFSGSDPNVRVAAPATFYVVPVMAANASAQAVNAFFATHVAVAGSVVVDGNAGLTLSGAATSNVSTASAVQARARLVVNSVLDGVDAVPGDGICATAGSVCTLRAAIMEANAHAGVDRIVLPAGTFTLSLAGINENAAATGDLDVTDTTGRLTLVGAGAEKTIISAAGIDRVFHLLASAALTLEDVTVTGGSVTGGVGAGLEIDGSASAIIRRCAFRGNTSATDGGAALATFNGSVTTIQDSVLHGNTGFATGATIQSAGSMSLSNCTISGNTGTSSTSVAVESAGAMSLLGCTVSGNKGGLRSIGSSITVEESIVAGNPSAVLTGDDVNTGTFVSGGYNVIGESASGAFVNGSNGDKVGSIGAPLDPKLKPLGDNGGPTLTQQPLSTSPAVDAGRCGALTKDQRGVKRPIDVAAVANANDGCDIGAYELESGAALARIEVPIRWCGLRGSPSVENPALMGATNVNDLLRRRHELVTDNIYTPQSGIVFRSAANYTIASFPVLEDPDCVEGPPGTFACTRGVRGDVYIDPDVANFDEYEALIAACRAAWHARDPKIEGITAVQINQFVNKNGTPLSILGIGGRAREGDAREQAAAGRVAVVDQYYRLSANPSDTIDRLLGHELGHALSLRHGDGIDNDLNGIVDDDDEASVGLPRFDGNNIMQYRSGSLLTSGQSTQARNHLLATVPDVSVQPFADAAPNSIPIDPKNASILDFGFGGVFGIANARILDFKNASILDFEQNGIPDFANARILDFKNASILDFKNASILDFGMSYNGETSAGSTTLNASTAAIPWPASLRPKTRYFFYLDVDRDDATGAYPPDKVNPGDAPNHFPGSNNLVNNPSVATEAGIDLIAEVDLESTCTGNQCSSTSTLRIYDYNDGTGVYAQVSSTPSPSISATNVGLYVDNGGAAVDLDSAPTGITVQPVIPNSLLFAAGWGFTTPPGGGAPVPNPVRMEVLSTIGCVGNILNDGSAASARDCQCTSCASCPNYPGCVGTVGVPQTLTGTSILTDDKAAELTFKPPVLPVCTVIPALAAQGQAVSVYVTNLPTNLTGTVEVSRTNTVIGTASTASISAAGSVSVPATLPSTALGPVTLSAGITGTAPRAQCLVTVTPQLACPDNDGDGICNAVDPDDDNDGVPDASDSAPLNPFVCRDTDGDGCDDCASGVANPLNDGPDNDHDGLCDRGDPDDDNDGVLDVNDGEPFNARACGDSDGDHCDDCVLGHGPDPAHDGPDSDGDGLCDFGDHDADNDGTLDWSDCAPTDATVRAVPLEVASVRFGLGGVKNRLSWTAPQSQGGSATLSDVLRGTRTGFPVGSGAETCLATGTAAAQFDDATSPTLGQVFWYLVRARNSCGTSGYGTTSIGAQRTSGVCP